MKSVHQDLDGLSYPIPWMNREKSTTVTMGTAPIVERNSPG